ncbi:MAG: hypothetical protein WC655_17460 [Candidatus Hydrogenedentales bacterium]|jgi:hypothetical protein
MARSRVPATLNRAGSDDWESVQLFISAERVGSVVLLKIDSIG